MRALLCLLVLNFFTVAAQDLTIVHRVPVANEIRGAALLNDQRILTWGDKLQLWSIPDLKPQVLAEGNFGEGGCLVDLDGDGTQEFIGKEGSGLGTLTWRKPPDWKPVVIDDQFESHDCLEATLFGRKGVLAIQRYMQVRFYEHARKTPWPYREIYSIYTPSQQTGLLLRDIDGDGRTDIVCGNYWIQSPERFELPWHIFAINTWFEQPLSAMLAHAFVGESLFFAQGHMEDARAALFRKPADPHQLWQESRLPGDFHRVHAAAVVGGQLFFAENNGGQSRIFTLRDGTPEKIASGIDTLRLLAVRGGIVSVGPRELVFWRYQRRR